MKNSVSLSHFLGVPETPEECQLHVGAFEGEAREGGEKNPPQKNHTIDTIA